MIPYGVHVVTPIDPPGAHVATSRFALHMLGKDDAAEAFAFQRRPAVLERDTLSGWGFAPSRHSGLPLLHDAVGVLECTVRAVIEYGDHHPFIAEVAQVHLRLPPQDRADQMILHMVDMGRTIYYGG